MKATSKKLLEVVIVFVMVVGVEGIGEAPNDAVCGDMCERFRMVYAGCN